MEHIISFARSSLHNIFHDKLYSIFYVIGTAIAFIFIVILLQALSLLKDDAAPFVNAGKSIYLGPQIEIGNDRWTISINTLKPLVESLSGFESRYTINTESTFAVINGKVRPTSVSFVSPEYFKINEFEFIEGKPFVEMTPRYAVVTEDIAYRYYNSDALGKKIEIQNVEYEIVGVVENYSSLANPLETASIWVPIKYNQFVPSANFDSYSHVLLFSENAPMDDIKAKVKHAFDAHYSRYVEGEVDIEYDQFLTVQEIKENAVGGEVFRYGIGVILILLLIIPALNIMTLSMSNTLSRSREIAIRRSFGASRMQSFMQIIIENFILVLIGLFISLLSVRLIIRFIENLFFNLISEVSFISASSLEWTTVCIAMCLAVVFTVLSGGIPAYIISKKNISSVLKGRGL